MRQLQERCGIGMNRGQRKFLCPLFFLFGISDISALLMRDVLTFRGTMKLDVMKRQGARMDLTSCQVGTKSRADELPAESAEDTSFMLCEFLFFSSRSIHLCNTNKIGIRPQRLDASARAFLCSVFYRGDNNYRNSVVSFCNTALLLIRDFFSTPLTKQKES